MIQIGQTQNQQVKNIFGPMKFASQEQELIHLFFELRRKIVMCSETPARIQIERNQNGAGTAGIQIIES
jgi:hypothetical protein